MNDVSTVSQPKTTFQMAIPSCGEESGRGATEAHTSDSQSHSVSGESGENQEVEGGEKTGGRYWRV